MKKLNILTIILFNIQFLTPIFAQIAQKPEFTIQSPTAISHFTLSPDGNFMVTSSLFGSEVTLWDISTRKQLRRFPLKYPIVTSLALSREGKLVAVANPNNGISLWDTATGLEVQSIATEKSGNFVFFDSQNRLFVGSESKGVKVLDISNNRMTNWLDAEGAKTSVSQNGDRIAVLNYKNLEIWDVNAGRKLVEIPQTSQYTTFLTIGFSPNGQHIVAGDTQGTIKIYNATTGREERTLLQGNISEPPNTEEFDKKFGAEFEKKMKAQKIPSNTSPEEQAKAYAKIQEQMNSEMQKYYSEMQKYSAEYYKQKSVALSQSVSSVAFNLDGTQLVSTLNNGKVILWDLITGGKIFEIVDKSKKDLQEASAFFSATSFSLDGNYLAVARGTGTVEFLNIKDKQTFGEIGTKNDIVRNLDVSGWNGFSSKGGLFGIFAENTLFWNLKAGGNPIILPKGELITVVSPDEKKAITLSEDGILRLKNIDGTGESVMFGKSESGSVFSNFTADGRYFATFAFSSADLLKKLMEESKNSEQATGTLNNKTPAFTWGSGKVTIWGVIEQKAVRNFKLSLGELPLSAGRANKFFLSADGKLFATITPNRIINLRSAVTGQIVRAIKTYQKSDKSKDENGENILQWLSINGTFAPTGQILAVTDETSLKLWNAQTGTEIQTLINVDRKNEDQIQIVPSFTFSPNGKFIFTQDSLTSFKIWNVADGKELVPLKISKTEVNDGKQRTNFNFGLGFYDNISVSSDSKTIAFNSFYNSSGVISEVKLLDVASGNTLCSVFLQGSDWVVLTPNGRFDSNKLENSEMLSGSRSDNAFKSLPLDAFIRDFYEPNLLPRLLKCNEEGNCNKEFKSVRDFSLVNLIQPKIKITKIVPTTSANTVEISAEVENATSEYQKNSQGKVLTSGVYDVRLFRDGQLVGNSTSDEKLQNTFRAYENFDEELAVWRVANTVELVNGKKTFTFKVKLPNNRDNQPIEFSAYAFNDDRVKSETAKLAYKPEKPNQNIKPRKAYIIAFGVNNSQNPERNLQFAAKDARVTQEILSKKLRERAEFAEVIEIPLISDNTTQDATKENVQTVFDLLSGKKPSAERLKNLGTISDKIQLAQPDDAVFISFSSHGDGDGNGIFYILPSNIGVNSGQTVTNELRKNSISSDELSLWLRDVDAGEMVMIIDACYAEWAVKNNNFKPAPMGSRGLGQLAFDKGMKILAATQSVNVANEVKEITEDNKTIKIEQGLLTYALIQEGLLKNAADFKAEDKIINLREWLQFAELRVPTLYEKSKSGNVKDVANPNPKTEKSIQQPYLFDFTRKKKDFVLAEIR